MFKAMVSWRTYYYDYEDLFFRICCISLLWYIYCHRGVFPSSKFYTRRVLNFCRPHHQHQAINVNSVSFSPRKDNVAFRLQQALLRFAVSCAAKKETLDKVCDIVKSQLVLADDADVSCASKCTDLGADSLDTIVNGSGEEG